MAPTPQEIQDREFREAFRGYNQDDVDTFLDEIAVEFGRLYQENQRMKVQLAALQQEVARLADAKDRAPAPAPSEPRPMDDAHIEAARKAADAALEEAKRRATDTINRAEQRAREIDELTARRAKDVDADASNALTDAQKRVADLRRQEAELRRRIRTFLEQQLAAMETVDLDAGGRSSGSAVVDRMTREFAEEQNPPPAPAAAVEPFWTGE
jgi:cell division initiation protein